MDNPPFNPSFSSTWHLHFKHTWPFTVCSVQVCKSMCVVIIWDFYTIIICGIIDAILSICISFRWLWASSTNCKWDRITSSHCWEICSSISLWLWLCPWGKGCHLLPWQWDMGPASSLQAGTVKVSAWWCGCSFETVAVKLMIVIITIINSRIQCKLLAQILHWLSSKMHCVMIMIMIVCGCDI